MKHREIRSIIIHCSATPEGKYFDAEDIDRWHKERGWNGIGYHFVILPGGEVQNGRPVNTQGAHVKGHNRYSIGICYIGGVDKNNESPKDTRTPDQEQAMVSLIKVLRNVYGDIPVTGHRDFPGVTKACPSFDVSEWMYEASI